jgi:hypothetical protein
MQTILRRLCMAFSLHTVQPTFFIYFSLWCRPPTGCRLPCHGFPSGFEGGAAVVDSDNLRKHSLECLRLAADCMELAGDVPRADLQSHFVRMAKVWTNLAERGPSAPACGISYAA